MTIISTTSGQESLRRNGVALIINKNPKCSTWVTSQRQQNDLVSFPRQIIQHHSNPSLCPNHWCQRNGSWLVLWRPITSFIESESHSVMSDSLWPSRTVACQAPLPIELSRQEYWSGLPFPSPGDLPDPGIKPGSSALQTDSILSEPPGKPKSF